MKGLLKWLSICLQFLAKSGFYSNSNTPVVVVLIKTQNLQILSVQVMELWRYLMVDQVRVTAYTLCQVSSLGNITPEYAFKLWHPASNQTIYTLYSSESVMYLTVEKSVMYLTHKSIRASFFDLLAPSALLNDCRLMGTLCAWWVAWPLSASCEHCAMQCDLHFSVLSFPLCP